ncbi:MAG: RNA polymerase sigma factor [Solirubrobacteraceae bacterium]
MSSKVIEPDLSDEALMLRVQRSDSRAFETLYDRHRQTVFWLAMRILDDRGLAADATQEAFISLWRNRDLYRPGRGRVKWWLLRIVRNGSIDLQRRNRDVVLRSEGLFELAVAPDSTEAEVLAEDARRELAVLLDQLPTEQREVIELAYFAGLTHAEMTQRLGVPLGTIKGRIRLALEKLRNSMPDDRIQAAR